MFPFKIEKLWHLLIPYYQQSKALIDTSKCFWSSRDYPFLILMRTYIEKEYRGLEILQR